MYSKEPEKVSEFYKTVFDWDIQHIPDLNYRIVNTGGGGINGGIMKPQDGPIPAPTTFYIDVDDLAAYRQKIVAAGGTMVVENQQVPGMGALSLFLDPDGRIIGLWKQGS
jgi:predicted enzyme related to lactoylglutathione lyase